MQQKGYYSSLEADRHVHTNYQFSSVLRESQNCTAVRLWPYSTAFGNVLFLYGG